MTQSLRELLPQFEQQSGDRLTVGYGNAGVVRTSAKHFYAVVSPALGIERQVRAKARLQIEGSAADFVRRGQAAIAVQQVDELPGIKGVTIVGRLPPALQKGTVYSAAITTRAQSPDAAHKLLAFLRSPPRGGW